MHAHRPSYLLQFLACVCSIVSLATSQDARTTENYDVRFLLARERVLLPGHRSTPDPYGEDMTRSGLVGEDTISAIDRERLLTFLQQQVGASFLDETRGPRLDLLDTGILTAKLSGAPWTPPRGPDRRSISSSRCATRAIRSPISLVCRPVRSATGWRHIHRR